MATKELTINDQIRAAYKARKRKITLPIGHDGRMVEVTIERKDRRVSYVAGGETVKATEKWLVVKPADGTLVPHMQIELTHLCNLRSKI